MMAWNVGFLRRRLWRGFRLGFVGSAPVAGRPGAKARRAALVVACLLLVLAAGGWAADALLRPSLYAWASSRAINVATQAISAAVREALRATPSPSFFTTVTDVDGNVVLIDYDMVSLNQVRADVADAIQRELAAVGRMEISLPLGLLTGIDALAGRGPRLPVQILPVGSVTAVPMSDFRAAGINFVNHRLYIHVSVAMRVIAPYLDATFPVEQEVVLSNQIVPGQVPSVYVGVEGIDLRQLRDGLLSLQTGSAR